MADWFTAPVLDDLELPTQVIKKGEICTFTGGVGVFSVKLNELDFNPKKHYVLWVGSGSFMVEKSWIGAAITRNGIKLIEK